MIYIASLEFILFLLFVTTLYYAIPYRFRKFLVFFTSILFLGNISVSFLIFAIGSSSFNFIIGIILDKDRNYRWSKIIYYISLFINIGALFTFKYLNAIIESINTFKGYNTLPVTSILIPVGISYYTFQSIGYNYRVYKEIETAETSFINYSIYTLFFPKILAGPIEKSNSFLPQLTRNKSFKTENITMGLERILIGIFKKLVIAENLGIIINHVNNNLSDYSGITLFFVFLIQPLYLYFDFSGYTDIAIGTARLFGYNLTENFKRPFLAPNVSVFWRRWHISLTAWCNEFIFMPVVYKRRKWKEFGAVYAVFLTFLVIGIWHGPRWNYVIVGLLNGTIIIIEFLTRRKRDQLFKHFPKGLSLNFGRILTYLSFCLTLVFFYSIKFTDSLLFIKQIFIKGGLILDWAMFFKGRVKLVLIPTLILIFLFYEVLKENKIDLKDFFDNSHYLMRYSFYYLLIFFIIWYGGTQQEFIYFQF